MQSAQPLSNLQQELLKLYSSDIEDADLENVRRFLAKYFADKAIKEADDIWDKKPYTENSEPYQKGDTK